MDAVNALTQLREQLPYMSHTERRIAETILEDPDAATSMDITALAGLTGTSPTSVTRMCGKAGFSGYRSLRIAIASAVSWEKARLDVFELDSGDTDFDENPRSAVSQTALFEMNAIHETVANLDMDVLASVAASICRASRVDIFGFGSSNLSGQDLQQKLLRLGYHAFCQPDVHMALTSAAFDDERTVVIGISNSGRTEETIECLDIAHRQGAMTVAITGDGKSPMIQKADVVLRTHAREKKFRSGAMAGRIAQLAVIDALFAFVAQENVHSSMRNLLRTRESVESHKIGDTGRPLA